MSGYRNPNLMAITLGREGDLTDTDAIVWQNQRGNSYTPSPVLYEGILYVLTDSGTLSAFDAKTGKPHYRQQRLPQPYQFKASPVGANGKLYLASETDDIIVVRMDRSSSSGHQHTAGQTFVATPAIVDGEIYLRGRTRCLPFDSRRTGTSLERSGRSAWRPADGYRVRNHQRRTATIVQAISIRPKGHAP